VSATRPSLRAIAAGATVVLVVLLVVVLSQSRHHSTGTNGAVPDGLKPLPATDQLCQPGERLEAGTARVRFRVQPGHRVGPFVVQVRTPGTGQAISEGRVPARTYATPDFAVASVGTIKRALDGATVCIRNDGPTRTSIYGQRTAAVDSAVVEPAPSLVAPYVHLRFDYSEGNEKSWWSFAGPVADRFGLVKATFFGSWTVWVVLAALLALALGTIWLAARAMAR
jgi:hypothetical protein